MTVLPELDAVPAPAAAMPGHTLPLGTRLREYEIRGLIGEGTCSIVYQAWDHSLERKVALKEYMPASMVGRIQGSPEIVIAADRHREAVRAGLKAFLNEARVLGRFDHPSLVKVYRFWEENGTAYMVMPHYEGPTLKTALAELGHVPSEGELRTWLKPILNAVTLLHDSATWHQNIAPDEIVLTPFGPVLLGFAAASHAIEAMKHTPAAALKAGFAAVEQYGSEAATTRGPWTDLYALAAVIYAAITGSEPAPAADRLAQDRLRPLSIVAAGLYSARFLAAIDAALAVQPKQRPADHTEFRALMGDIEAPQAVSLAPRPDLMQEPFTGPGPSERVVTVPDRPLLAAAETVVPPAAAPVPQSAEARPPRRAARAAPPRPAPDGGEATPSWMQATGARVRLGKRSLYFIVAGSFALIGIAALVLQFASRPSGRAPQASAAASAAIRNAPAAAPNTTVAAPARPSPATTTTTTATATATPTARPGGTIVTAGTAAPDKPAPPPAVATAAAARTPAPAAMLVEATPADRQARCTEILQKASLEKITAAETDFFKRECK